MHLITHVSARCGSSPKCKCSAWLFKFCGSISRCGIRASLYFSRLNMPSQIIHLIWIVSHFLIFPLHLCPVWSENSKSVWLSFQMWPLGFTFMRWYLGQLHTGKTISFSAQFYHFVLSIPSSFWNLGILDVPILTEILMKDFLWTDTKSQY